ncbi:MAG TPA: amidohydrolase family protein [Acidobacteriota bacterium]|nr:amidohydrolase family protein [Acidobacteriota bacterium]
MRLNRISVLVVCILAAAWLPGEVTLLAQEVRPMLLENGWILDGTGSQPYRASVLVRDGKIAWIGEGRPDGLPPRAQVIDLGGRYLLPGFIDAHVHISGPDPARRALLSGVTTARSMGIDHFADVGLRELIEKGAAEGPEMLAAGYHIRPQVSPRAFLDNPDLSDLMDGLKGQDAFRRMAQFNLGRGVDWLKIVATDRAGLPTTDPRRQIMSLGEARAVVQAAEDQGIPVAAHAHGDAGARAAVEAGVRSIEHGTYLSEETLRLMKEKGTFLVPTVAVVRDLTEAGGDYDNPTLRMRGRHMLPRVCSMVGRAFSMGVPVVASTDTGYSAQSLLRMPHDILELTRCGLSPMQALQAATQTGARLLRIEDRTGTIQAGLEADLIVVEDNPLEDVVTLQDVMVVIHDGRTALSRLP